MIINPLSTFLSPPPLLPHEHSEFKPYNTISFIHNVLPHQLYGPVRSIHLVHLKHTSAYGYTNNEAPFFIRLLGTNEVEILPVDKDQRSPLAFLPPHTPITRITVSSSPDDLLLHPPIGTPIALSQILCASSARTSPAEDTPLILSHWLKASFVPAVLDARRYLLSLLPIPTPTSTPTLHPNDWGPLNILTSTCEGEFGLLRGDSHSAFTSTFCSTVPASYTHPIHTILPSSVSPVSYYRLNSASSHFPDCSVLFDRYSSRHTHAFSPTRLFPLIYGGNPEDHPFLLPYEDYNFQLLAAFPPPTHSNSIAHLFGLFDCGSEGFQILPLLLRNISPRNRAHYASTSHRHIQFSYLPIPPEFATTESYRQAATLHALTNHRYANHSALYPNIWHGSTATAAAAKTGMADTHNLYSYEALTRPLNLSTYPTNFPTEPTHASELWKNHARRSTPNVLTYLAEAYRYNPALLGSLGALRTRREFRATRLLSQI